jgi:predicted DNA-binding WGR domain protein
MQGDSSGQDRTQRVQIRAFGEAEAVEGRAELGEIRRMSIYWMRTADVYLDGGYDESYFMTFDPEVRFPRFHMTEGDETTCSVRAMAARRSASMKAGALPAGASSMSIGTTCRPSRRSTCGMPDELRSPIKHHVVLHRIDPEEGIRRFYSLMIERDLFGIIRLVHNWGRIGTKGQEKAEEFASEDEAGEALETLAQAMRQQCYQDF